MAVDYVCAVNKDHPKKTFALPQNQLPMCCGKPMRLVASVPQPVATPAQPAGATVAKPQPQAKPVATPVQPAGATVAKPQPQAKPVATPIQPAGATAAKPQPQAKPSYQKPTPQKPQKGTPPKR